MRVKRKRETDGTFSCMISIDCAQQCHSNQFTFEALNFKSKYNRFDSDLMQFLHFFKTYCMVEILNFQLCTRLKNFFQRNLSNVGALQRPHLRTHDLKKFGDVSQVKYISPFQLQISASVRKLPLRATWTTIAAPTLPAVAVRELTLLFVTERRQNTTSVQHFTHNFTTKSCVADVLQPEHLSWTYSIVVEKRASGWLPLC